MGEVILVSALSPWEIRLDKLRRISHIRHELWIDIL
jgi:hypothetical protein